VTWQQVRQQFTTRLLHSHEDRQPICVDLDDIHRRRAVQEASWQQQVQADSRVLRSTQSARQAHHRRLRAIG